MGMGFQFELHRLGLLDLSWDLKKTIFWEMGLAADTSSRLERPKKTVHRAWLRQPILYSKLGNN